MHESPVARELVQAAANTIDTNERGRITRLKINLGPDGGYLPDSLEMHIRAVAIGTPVEGAEIEITQVLNGGPELVSLDVEESS